MSFIILELQNCRVDSLHLIITGVTEIKAFNFAVETHTWESKVDKLGH